MGFNPRSIAKNEISWYIVAPMTSNKKGKTVGAHGVCDTPPNAENQALQPQPQQQHQGVLLGDKPKKRFHDHFREGGQPRHLYPSAGHPACG